MTWKLDISVDFLNSQPSDEVRVQVLRTKLRTQGSKEAYVTGGMDVFVRYHKRGTEFLELHV